MSAAEVMAQHQWGTGACICGPMICSHADMAFHQLDALKAAGYEVVAVPVGGWVASMTPVDPVAGEGNFMAQNGQWYRADDATEARS